MRLETSRGWATEQSVEESGMHFLGLKLKSEFLKLAMPHLHMLSEFQMLARITRMFFSISQLTLAPESKSVSVKINKSATIFCLQP